MHICYITQAGFDDPGAENTHATEVIRHLVKAGVRVTVLHPSRHASVRSLGADERKPSVVRFGLRRIWFQMWLFFVLWRRPGDVDAIYVRQAALMLIPALLRRRLGVPIVAEFNTCFGTRENARGIPVLLRLLRIIERRGLKEYDRIIVISSQLKTIITDEYGTPPGRIEVVHNGTNLDLMRPLPKIECRRALQLPEHAFVVAFVGHLYPWQGVSQLIDAVAELDRAASGDVHLVIAGTSRDLVRYEAQASVLGLERRVHFLGAVDYERVPAIISAADVAAAPGDPTESTNYRIRSPLKVYEYLACGRPVIAGELESLRELFSGDPVGFLIGPGNTTHLVTAINTLRLDPGLAERMGSNARRIADRSLSWSAVAERLIAILRSAASDSAPTAAGANRANRA
jgi:glycosyltransferase involved in cell wall biosynthesis